MFALNLLAGLLAASIASASPIAEGATLESRQTNWTCPHIDIGGGIPVVTSTDGKNGLCCTTGFSYIHPEGREACCRNDPALLEHEHYKYALPCSSEWWTTASKIVAIRTCNLDAIRRCWAECDNVPWLYPTPKPCPARN